MSLLDEDQYSQWKTTLVPLIYDWFANHNLDWPSQTCRWGPKLEDATYKSKFRVYLSEQTDDSEPQKLKIVNAEVCKPRVAASEAVSYWKDMKASPYIKDYKIIHHPGEVNKIREIPQHPNIVVTHTDSPNLYVWNIDKQPSRSKADKKKAPPSVADLMLVGHEADAQFPLSTCSTQPLVASGGADCLVLLWDLQDSMESLLAGTSGGSAGAKEAPTLDARVRLEGHTATVEDVVFQPKGADQLASVGDDHLLLLWDTRTGTAPVLKVEQAHGEHDIHCVDWSRVQEHLIATGAADGSLKVWDHRNLGPGKELHTFKVHRDAIMRIEWHPTAPHVLASGGDDRRVLVWDLSRAKPPGQESVKRPRNTDNPPELLLQHVGHRQGKVVDFQWNQDMPWTMMSVSDNTADEEGGGGTLQMWRLQDLIYRPDEEVLQELEDHREFVLHGKHNAKPAKRATAEPSAAAAEAAAQAPPAAAPEAAPLTVPEPELLAPPVEVGGAPANGADAGGVPVGLEGAAMEVEGAPGVELGGIDPTVAGLEQAMDVDAGQIPME